MLELLSLYLLSLPTNQLKTIKIKRWGAGGPPDGNVYEVEAKDMGMIFVVKILMYQMETPERRSRNIAREREREFVCMCARRVFFSENF